MNISTTPNWWQTFKEQSWHFLRQDIIIFLWLIMDVTFFTPFILVLMPWTRFWSPLAISFLLASLILVPFYLGRLLAVLKANVIQQQLLVMGTYFLTILLGTRLTLYPGYGLSLSWISQLLTDFFTPESPFWGRQVLLFFFVTLAWWRGTRLLRRAMVTESMGFQLRLTALVYFPLVIIFSHQLYPWSIVPFILVHFGASLIAMALVRAEDIEQSHSQKSFPLTPRWLGGVSLASLIIVIFTAILIALLTGNSMANIFNFLTPVWNAIKFAAATAGAIFVYLMAPFIEFILQAIFGLFNLFSPDNFDFGERNENLIELGNLYQEFLEEASKEQEAREDRFWPILLLRFGIATTLILLIALSLHRIYGQRRFADNIRRDINEIDTADGVTHQTLTDRLRAGFNRLQQWRAAASIRRIYAQMTQMATDYGYPRPATTTPLEYLSLLSQAWPDHQVETNLITQAFIRIRYGEIPETEAELAEIRSAWGILKQNRPQLNED
ncbi:MAG TPA: DUF4129 domain-containing protein [Anaerolineae bacterium]|nr:DUF4129 domain-containing protein [Anaerolineae bacterium]